MVDYVFLEVVLVFMDFEGDIVGYWVEYKFFVLLEFVECMFKFVDGVENGFFEVVVFVFGSYFYIFYFEFGGEGVSRNVEF